MIKLYQTTPSRLFTFGCSFTDYKWASWANILGLELDCEFYNFGRSGAGNFYIANLISQADSYFNFNDNDLVIVCWTNTLREDRWTYNGGWLTPGNIYNQQIYGKEFVSKWANDVHYCLRDFALIKLINDLLKSKTQYHFLSMCNVSNKLDQWTIRKENEKISTLVDLYSPVLNKILPSFYDVLWNDDLNYKFDKDSKTIHPLYFDGHPTIMEHKEYLEKTFNYNFNENTEKTIKNMHDEWLFLIKKTYDKFSKKTNTNDLPTFFLNNIAKNFKNKKSNPIPDSLFN